uniref:Zinc finger protein n=1 Tax=Lotharella oceanica TaxID=641309 RepID=A0A7S2TVM8_9EUKA|mmetsp:Transcript_30172/g.56359  ORF Transcript_30172/g.56359 Transcript_30172/m.56359 type:complete len:148 (+) Transcript_30172:62-505(+)
MAVRGSTSENITPSQPVQNGSNLQPIAISQPANDMLTTMCPSCRQLMQLPKYASMIMCPLCSCTSRIRVKYTMHVKCTECAATLRCEPSFKRIRCPRCNTTVQVSSQQHQSQPHSSQLQQPKPSSSESRPTPEDKKERLRKNDLKCP